ncbi:hypothetical protein [Kibdelosporangium aridum]|uniref:hypothetical protein n=1 Tax=Kibdelosporangium aridum TaxID=2030 RepID=UPI001179E8FD|nr:hypothetical protein [Kibdelosporangium aridum]
MDVLIVTALLGYLKAVNDFGALAARTLVAEATTKIAQHSADTTQAIDDRTALIHMPDVLVELVSGSE